MTHQGKDITVFVCGGGGVKVQCTGPGCASTNTARCAFPLQGAKLGQTCGRAVCEAHARQGAAGALCLAHAKREQSR